MKRSFQRSRQPAEIPHATLLSDLLRQHEERERARIATAQAAAVQAAQAAQAVQAAQELNGQSLMFDGVQDL